MRYSYWEIFYNPKIPLIERVGLAALSPLVIPGAAVAAVLSMEGCTEQDDPLPFPKGAEKPQNFVRNKDVESHDVAPEDVFTCTPDPCPPDHIDMGRRKGDQALCISFSKSVLTSKGTHRALSAVDVNGDGRMDLYVLNQDSPHALYMNKGVDGFADVAKEWGAQISGKHSAAIWEDLDNDNDNDLILATIAGAKLFVNTGNVLEEKATLGDDPVRTAYVFSDAILLGTENGIRFYEKNADWKYEEAAQKRGFFDSGSANRFAVADFDNDGDPDIYVANETGANRMYLNENGQFQSVEEKYKLQNPSTGSSPNPYGQVPSMDAQWVKTAHSASLGLYVANYNAASWFFFPKPDGTYMNSAASIGLQDNGNTIRSVWGNFLNEDSPALFLARTYTKDSEKDKQVSLLYIPTRDASGQIISYRDIAYPYGMSGPAKLVGAEWGDFNGDGSLDLATAAYDGAITVYYNDSKWVKVCP